MLSSRANTRRATADVPPPSSSRASRSRISLNVQHTEPEEGDTENEDNAEDDDDDVDALTPEPGPSRAPPVRRGRGRPRGSRGRGRGGGGGRMSRERTRTGTADEEGDGGRGVRLRKSVSYAEIGAGEEEDEEMDDEAGAEEVEPEAPGIPRRRARTSEQPAGSPSKREFERVGSGRGGFSVKGAASAAARARWAKYRSEKADESDDGERRVKRGAGGIRVAKGDNRSAAEKIAEGTVLEIKGKEYTVGDDEVILEDDEKGDGKVDADGRLLGDREYRLVTFTSVSRKNPNRIYALTIDAARACGYSDSLAFLRRCPQILKLACMADERQMLIDIGRVTGNLKNRMVTMVSMRNVYKLMGARVVKNGKWVADDYYEDKAMADCLENGFTPFADVHEDEILSNAMANMQPVGRQPGFGANEAGGGGPVHRSVLSLAPTYTLGGPTTHFAGSGIDPWSEAGWGNGNKRQKLKSLGVSEEDWMYRTALETRGVDEQLKEYREERLGRLHGPDLKGWVWSCQKIADGDSGKREQEVGDEKGKAEREPTAEWLRPPMPERRASGLSHEVIPEDMAVDGVESVLQVETPADVDMGEPEGVKQQGEGEIIIETEAEAAERRAKLASSAGSWEPGVVRAVIEPHTHTPHVPLHTQPCYSTFARLSHNPLIASLPDKTYQHHIQSSLSGRAAKGLASVEFVFEPRSEAGEGEHAMRMRMVREAEEWEREMRARKAVAAAEA